MWYTTSGKLWNPERKRWNGNETKWQNKTKQEATSKTLILVARATCYRRLRLCSPEHCPGSVTSCHQWGPVQAQIIYTYGPKLSREPGQIDWNAMKKQQLIYLRARTGFHFQFWSLPKLAPCPNIWRFVRMVEPSKGKSHTWMIKMIIMHMHIWQPRVAFQVRNWRWQHSRRVALAVYNPMYGNILRRAGHSLRYVEFATTSMPTSEGPAMYTSTLSDTATTWLYRTFVRQYSLNVWAWIFPIRLCPGS